MRPIFLFKRLKYKKIGIWFGCGHAIACWFGISFLRKVEFEVRFSRYPKLYAYTVDFHDECGRQATVNLGCIELSVMK